MKTDADLLVVGSGVAGLAATLAAVERGARVTLLAAGPLLSGSSPWAQGGVAAAIGADDDPALHAADTLAVGAGLNDATAVATLTRGGRAIVRDLIASGVPFDRGSDGPDLGLEAGHGRRRILHARGGATGRALTEALLARVIEHPLVRVRPHTPAEALVVEGGRVAGVRSGAAVLRGRAVVLATGGYASLWERTTNSGDTRGTGLALAYRAGASLADLEFVQFHPTALLLPGQPAFLLTEALRGEGARLVDDAERPIVDPLLARDIVARAVARHRRDHGPVYLSLRHLEADFVRARFPNIAERLRDWGLDLARDLLPVAPAAHYCMGGIRTDSDGCSDVPGLYAAGEVACTGVQGANRLASNSLLECLVFGQRAASAALTDGAETRAAWAVTAPPSPPMLRGASVSAPSAVALSDPLRMAGVAAPVSPAEAPSSIGARGGVTLDAGLGVERDAAPLAALIAALPEPSPDVASDADLIAALAARAAYLRRESRGAHYRTDAPDTEPQWRGRIHWRRDTPPRFEEIY